MAKTFYILSVYCDEPGCDVQLQPERNRCGVYLHHPKSDCDNSDKYYFPPKVALDEAWVPPEKK
jgi:hypothetical protein